MPAQTLFIMTHLGSQWSSHISFLENNPRYNIFCTGNIYRHPSDLQQLLCLPHKRKNAASIWVDVLEYNYQFTMKHLSRSFPMLFIQLDFEDCLPELRRYFTDDYHAASYWQLRIAGMKEYFRRNPSSQWINLSESQASIDRS